MCLRQLRPLVAEIPLVALAAGVATPNLNWAQHQTFVYRLTDDEIKTDITPRVVDVPAVLREIRGNRRFCWDTLDWHTLQGDRYRLQWRSVFCYRF
jgi:hypothetical protein